jgi:hypothetical protein
VTYSDNTPGRRSGLSLAQPGGSVWSNGFLYDASARLTNVTSLAGSFGYLYEPACATLPGKLALPGGAYITNLYGSVARLASTALKDSSGTLLNSHGYQHKLAGQRSRQTRTDASYVDYTYDALNELATAVGSGG